MTNIPDEFNSLIFSMNNHVSKSTNLVYEDMAN